MSGLNRATFIGNLGKDPEMRYLPDGRAVANTSLATTERWKDKTSGEKQEKTEWHNLVFFGKSAEIAGQYLKKGSKIYVEGRLQTRKWQDKEGKDRYTTEIVVSDFQMLDRRENGGSEEQPPERKPAAAAPASRQPEQRQHTGGGGAPGPAPGDFDDDDVPFITNGGIL